MTLCKYKMAVLSAVAEAPQAGGGEAKATEMYSPLVLEAGRLRSRCRQCHALSEGSQGGSFLASSSVWGLPEIRGVPGLMDTALQPLPLFVRGFLPACLSASVSLTFSYKTPIILDLGPTLLQYDLI